MAGHNPSDKEHWVRFPLPRHNFDMREYLSNELPVEQRAGPPVETPVGENPLPLYRYHPRLGAGRSI